MLLLENDLYELLIGCCNQNYERKFSEMEMMFTNQSACCVVIAPVVIRKYEKGKVISGLDSRIHGMTIVLCFMQEQHFKIPQSPIPNLKS